MGSLCDKRESAILVLWLEQNYMTTALEGHPRTVPVWFAVDGEELFSATADRREEMDFAVS